MSFVSNQIVLEFNLNLVVNVKADLIYEIKMLLFHFFALIVRLKINSNYTQFFLLLIQLNLTLGIFMFSAEIILLKNGNLNMMMMMMIRTQINKKSSKSRD